MPTLNWIGKEAVVKHHKEVPFRLLEPVAEFSGGDADSGNLIVQGDNLHALKALLPRYALTGHGSSERIEGFFRRLLRKHAVLPGASLAQ